MLPKAPQEGARRALLARSEERRAYADLRISLTETPRGVGSAHPAVDSADSRALQGIRLLSSQVGLPPRCATTSCLDKNVPQEFQIEF